MLPSLEVFSQLQHTHTHTHTHACFDFRSTQGLNRTTFDGFGDALTFLIASPPVI